MAEQDEAETWHAEALTGQVAVLGVVDDVISCAIELSSERSRAQLAAAFAVSWAVAQVAKTVDLLHVAATPAARPAAPDREAPPSGVDRLAVGQNSLKAETTSQKPVPIPAPEPELEPTTAQPESPRAVFTVTPDSSLQRSDSEKAILAELSRLEDERVRARLWEQAPPEIDKSIQAECVTRARLRPSSSSASFVGWRVASAPSKAKLPKIRRKSTNALDHKADAHHFEAEPEEAPTNPLPKARDLTVGVVVRTSDGRKIAKPDDDQTNREDDQVRTAAPPPTPPPDRRTPLAARPARRRGGRPKSAGLLWCWGLDGHRYLGHRSDIDWQVLMFTTEPDLLPAPLRLDVALESCRSK